MGSKDGKLKKEKAHRKPGDSDNDWASLSGDEEQDLLFEWRSRDLKA